MTYRLWDEQGRKLVGFDHLRAVKVPSPISTREG